MPHLVIENPLGLENSLVVRRCLGGSRLPLPQVIQIEAGTRVVTSSASCASDRYWAAQVVEAPIFGSPILIGSRTYCPCTRRRPFSGVGEPLLHPQMPELPIARRKAHRCRVHIATYGTLLAPELAERLINSELDYLHIAFDSATVEGYHAVRRSQQFPQLVAAVACLNQLKTERGSNHPPRRAHLCHDEFKYPPSCLNSIRAGPAIWASR